MKRLNNRSGFTLIEIIVVLIILGVLAAIALPNLFSNIARSRSTEATASIAAFRNLVEACIARTGVAGGAAVSPCTGAAVGATGAGNTFPPTTNFTYTLTSPLTTNDTNYTIVAAGGGAGSALAAGDTITVTRAAAAFASPPVYGAVTCTSAGALAGTC